MRKQTKRKHYDLVNVIDHAIAGAAITDESRLNQLKTVELSSLEALSKGQGRVNEWWDMTNVLNIAETMALAGIGPEVLPYCEAAQIELQAAAKRYEATGKMGLTGAGIQAMRELISFHDLQRRSVCRAEYFRHIKRTQDRLRSKAPEVVEI